MEPLKLSIHTFFKTLSHFNQIKKYQNENNSLTSFINKTTHGKETHSLPEEILIFLTSQEAEKYLKDNPIPAAHSFVYFAKTGKKFNGHSLADKILLSGNWVIGTREGLMKLEEVESSPSFPEINENKSTPLSRIEMNPKNLEKYNYIRNHPQFLCFETSHQLTQAINSIVEKCLNVNHSQFQTIAVTGTNGKTSVTEMLAYTWKQLAGETILKIGTLGIVIGEETLPGSHITTPDYPTFLKAAKVAKEKGVSRIAMEASSHGLAEERLGNWKNTVSIFTNLTQDHLDFHGTMDNYRQAKSLLFSKHTDSNGTVVLHTFSDEWSKTLECIRRYINENHLLKPSFAQLYGTGQREKMLPFFNLLHQWIFPIKLHYFVLENERASTLGTQGTIIHYQSQKSNILEVERFDFYLDNLYGTFQAENTVCAAAALSAIGYPLEKILAIMQNLPPISGRLERVKIPGVSLPLVFVDYAHTPDALEKSLSYCQSLLSLQTKGKVICVFGCGGDRDREKRPQMGKVSWELADSVVLTSDNPRYENPDCILEEIQNGIDPTLYEQKSLHIERDRTSAIHFAISQCQEHDIVLIAGKGHENYQEANGKTIPFSDKLVAEAALYKHFAMKRT